MVRHLLQQRAEANQPDIWGQVMTQVRLVPWDTAGTLMPVVDVLVNRPGGTKFISAVPVAATNQELGYVAIGSPVRLRRSRTGRVEVVGVDKRAAGGVVRYTLVIENGVPFQATASVVFARVLTLGELGNISGNVSGNVFGETPMGSFGVFDYFTSNYLHILENT